MSAKRKRVVIIGGVAAGASCATRMRRLCEECDIVMLERGEYVSFANCGLPYYVGDVIKQEEDLIVASPAFFQDRFRIDVRLFHEVTKINRAQRTLVVHDLKQNKEFELAYDDVVIATGASSIVPPFSGLQEYKSQIQTVKTVDDAKYVKALCQDLMKAYANSNKARRPAAVVIGGGFIGCEVSENLRRSGMDVTIVEMFDHILPPLESELAGYVTEHVRDAGVQLRVQSRVVGFTSDSSSSSSSSSASSSSNRWFAVELGDGERIPCNLVILSVGVKPNSGLAKDAGLELGLRGSIVVNKSFQTTRDKHVYAIGDVTQTMDFVTQQPTHLPLAGPANLQGRQCAAVLLRGQTEQFRGVQGTAVMELFGETVAMTGASRRSLLQEKIPFEEVNIHPGHHVGYYPQAKKIHLKLFYHAWNGRVLAAQAVGQAGVDKRIDVIAMCIQMRGTIYDLAESQLCYSPQFGAAKDPVNMAGMAAINQFTRLVHMVQWRTILQPTKHNLVRGVFRPVLLDVRMPEERKTLPIEGLSSDIKVIGISLEELRDAIQRNDASLAPFRYAAQNTSEALCCFCQAGQRSYYAARLLQQHGFVNVFSVSGGYLTQLRLPRPKL